MAAILAAAMSNLSAALNSLASTTIMDFYKPMRPDHEESHYLKLSKLATLFWGVVLFLIGLVSQGVPSVLEAGLSIASVIYGGLLGVFLLGRLTARVGERAAIAGMAAGLGIVLYIYFATKIAWTWYVLTGSGVTFATGYLASYVITEKPKREQHV